MSIENKFGRKYVYHVLIDSCENIWIRENFEMMKLVNIEIIQR